MIPAHAVQADSGRFSGFQRRTASAGSSTFASFVLAFSLFFAPVFSLRAPAQEPSQPQNPFQNPFQNQFQDLSSRAATARDEGNVTLAIDLYGQAVTLKADWAEGWFYLGLLEYSSDRFAGAIDAFDRFLALEPNAAPAWALRGLCRFETGAYDDALTDLEQGMKRGAADEPHNAEIIRTHYAELLTRAGRFEDAIAQYQFLSAQHIDNPDLKLGLALAGTWDTALPGDVPAPSREILESIGGAGNTYLAGESDEADAAFQQVFARYPATAAPHFFYGNLLYSHGSALAIDQLRQGLAIEPDNAYARTLLALALIAAGRYSEARPEAEKAVLDTPHLEMADVALGRALIETGTIETGTGAQSQPPSQPLNQPPVTAPPATGDDKRAFALLQRVLQQDPNNLEAHLALAALYSRVGSRDDEYRERMLCLQLERQDQAGKHAGK
jgi:tetratricopeptide (TPR) repeat protein